MRKKSEADLLEEKIKDDSILALSKKYYPHGFFQVRQVGFAIAQSGNPIKFGIKGQADIWGMLYGIHVEVEMKKPGEKIRKQEQIDWRTCTLRCGAIHVEATSVEEVLNGVEIGLSEWRRRYDNAFRPRI